MYSDSSVQEDTDRQDVQCSIFYNGKKQKCLESIREWINKLQ